MNKKDELLQRAYHWLEDAPGGAHSYGCRGSMLLPQNMRERCNCGRDELVSAIAHEAFEHVEAKATNGHGL